MIAYDRPIEVADDINVLYLGTMTARLADELFLTERNLANLITQAAPLALVVALGSGLAIGATIGFFVAKVGIPSFVVTLGLFLGLQGVILLVIGAGGTHRMIPKPIEAIQNANMPVWAGWTMLAVAMVATYLLDRTRYGRYLYAIGGNREAARRSGVNVALIKGTAFMIGSSLAVLAVSGAVLILAATVDALARRRNGAVV